MKRNKIRAALTAVIAVFVMGSMSACFPYSNPDEVGLYYWQGSIDGNEFGYCVAPGQTADDMTWSNEVVYLPTNQREWKITPDSTDQNTPIVASTKPKLNQTNSLPANVWVQIKLKLNTNCDDIKDYPGGTLRKFWEDLGRRDWGGQGDVTEPGGWKEMMKSNVVTTLTTATNTVTRQYDIDDLETNKDGVRTEVQSKISDIFGSELKRATGGNFFCGPTFNRVVAEEEGQVAEGTCPPVEVILIDIDYSDPNIIAARNQKQVELENAAAQIAKAQGESQANLIRAKSLLEQQQTLSRVMSDPNYRAYLEKQMDVEIAKSCSGSQNCTLVVTSGDQSVNVTAPSKAK